MGTAEIWCFTEYNETDKTVSGEITLNTVSGQPGYVVPESAKGVAYLVCDANTGVGFGNGLGTEWNEEINGLKVYKLEPYEYYREYGELIINPRRKTGTVYRVQFTGQPPHSSPPPPEGGGMYTTAITDAASAVAWENVGEKLGGSDNWIWGYVVPESANGVAYFVCQEGWHCVQGAQSDERSSLNVEQVDGQTGVYKITPGDAYGGSGDFRLENSNGGGMGIIVIFNGYDPDVLAPAHAVTDAERTERLANSAYGAVPFDYNGQTYYMGLAFIGSDLVHSLDTIGSSAGDTDYWSLRIGFWTYDNSSGYKIVSSELRDQIINSVFDGEPDINIYAVGDAGKIVPAEVRVTQYCDWPSPRSWKFDADSRGDWEFRATWKLKDGDVLTARSLFSYMAFDDVESGELYDVAQVNEWLSNAAEEHEGEHVKIVLNLLPIEYNGIIYVPPMVEVEINGANGENGGRTVLNGGVLFTSGSSGVVNNINFVGAGSNKHWSDHKNGNDHLPNYALFGEDGTTNYSNCTFKGYYHAVHNADGFTPFGNGMNCVFEDNHVGISIDLSDGASGWNPELVNATFKENDIAIELNSFGDRMPREMIVSHCKFINNDVDVYNESGRNFFMPGNYFYHDRQSDGSHNYIETDSKNPGKDKKDNKNLVSAYPMMNEDFTEYIYGEDDVAVPNSGEESYMTPYSELPGMDIMVVETGGAEDVPPA